MVPIITREGIEAFRAKIQRTGHRSMASLSTTPSSKMATESDLIPPYKLAWTALYGQVISGENCPIVAGSCPPAGETASNCASASQRTATDGNFDRIREPEHS